MTDYIADFGMAMVRAGCETRDQIIADGNLHRVNVVGDRRWRRNAWYVLFDGDHPAGAFGCYKRGIKMTWSAKGVTPLTREERAAIHAKAKADRQRREVEDARRMAAGAVVANKVWNESDLATEHDYLLNKQIGAHGARMATWKKERIDPVTGEVTEIEIPNALIIPIKNSKREIVSLQAIFKNDNNPLGRNKDYLVGGAKRGCFNTVGTPALINGRQTLIIAEGFSTSASLYEATGIGTVIAFDAGNLLPVAQEVRRVMPNATIVLAADDDWKTKGNPGLTNAKTAAQAVGGIVVLPMFAKKNPKFSDFNDLAVSEGLEAVKVQVLAAITPPEAISDPDEPPPYGEPPDSVEPPDDPSITAASVLGSHNAVATHVLDGNPHFSALGYSQEHLHFLVHETGMVRNIRANANSIKAELLNLAPAQYWDDNFERCRGAGERAAVNAVIRLVHSKGVFNPERIRGRGAWIDAGRIVFHYGENLLVDGSETDCSSFLSKFLYTRCAPITPPANDASSDAEGRKIYDIIRRFRWKNPASAILLSGWVALAPVCGALKWRPHVHITGPKGSGKTTLHEEVIQHLLGDTAIYVLGQTTEAGIRQTLGHDARPLQFDEAEQNSERDMARMMSIYGLLRQASSQSAARILKGTVNGEAQKFSAKTMAVLASIVVHMDNDADRSRFVVVALRAADATEQATFEWRKLSADIADLCADPELSGRLLRRALINLPTTLKNIDLFRRVAAKELGSARDGDQYGTLLAGAWSLVNSREATNEEAEQLVSRYELKEYVEHTETDDSKRALEAVFDAQIRGDQGKTYTVIELLRELTDQRNRGVVTRGATERKLLQRYGLDLSWNETSGSELLVSNTSSRLQSLMNGTAFVANVRSFLSRIQGVRQRPAHRFGGSPARCIAIPLAEYLKSDEDPTTAREPGDDAGAELDVPF